MEFKFTCGIYFFTQANSKIILKLLLEKKKILYSNYVMDSGKIANSNTRKGNDIE